MMNRLTFFACVLICALLLIPLTGCRWLTNQNSNSNTNANGNGNDNSSQPQTLKTGLTDKYITMSDGTKIAVSIWIPEDMEYGDKASTVMRITRYWRAMGFAEGNPFGIEDNDDNSGLAEPLNAYGYVFVEMDVRGTGASYGSSPFPWDDQEVDDFDEVIDWITEQPWSNGRVGAMGVSYEGNTAALISCLRHPAVKAVVPQFYDFQPYFNAFPGGAYNHGFIDAWSDSNEALDHNDVCALIEEYGIALDCDALKTLVYGPRAADEDTDHSMLNEAIEEHSANVNLKETLKDVEFINDTFGDTGMSMNEVNLYKYREAVNDGNDVWFSWGSWLDAGDDALRSFLTFDNPQIVIIGAWNHGGNMDTDPFRPVNTEPTPSSMEQFGEIVTFFSEYLDKDETPSPTRVIQYCTLGEETWRSTTVWPPADVEPQTWYLGDNHTFGTSAPGEDSGSDDYTIDFTATTGTDNRYFTQLGGGDVIYPDRAAEDQKLLTYTSAPLEADMRVTGTPTVSLYVRSTATDGVFHVYLEDVDENGRVTYITEGVLRAIHRKVSDEAPEHELPGFYHTFKREDAQPLMPGEVAEIHMNMKTTSVLFKAGHRIRLAIAGADADTFERIPTDETPTITVERNSVYPSQMMLPVATAD